MDTIAIKPFKRIPLSDCLSYCRPDHSMACLLEPIIILLGRLLVRSGSGRLVLQLVDGFPRRSHALLLDRWLGRSLIAFPLSPGRIRNCSVISLTPRGLVGSVISLHWQSGRLTNISFICLTNPAACCYIFIFSFTAPTVIIFGVSRSHSLPVQVSLLL